MHAIRVLVAMLLLTMISGCVGFAHELNLRNAERYAQSCRGWQGQHEWWKARWNCSRAVVNATLGRAPDNAIAALWYEYGRTSGAICDYKEAKRGLDEAPKLDERANGPAFITLLELARLNYEQGQFQEAYVYYERAEKALPMDRATREDAIGYAEMLEEYALSANRLDNAAKGRMLLNRAKDLRQANTDKTFHTDRTPYGKFCDQKS